MANNPGFEPEIIFPEQAYDAARVYLGVMAYPEQGAGEIGASGQTFATALGQYQLWAAQKVKGLPFVRAARNDPNYVGPRRREFEGILDRGLRRIDRRVAAYDLYGSQLLSGFFGVHRLGAQAIRDGLPEEAFHVTSEGAPAPARTELWEQGTPSAHKMINSFGDHWLERFALNRTGRSADAKQRTKDVYRRGLAPSIPVLHMAHALAEAAREVGPKLSGWDERDPWIALMMNAELWIWEALETAETWRVIPHIPCGLSLTPDKMIKLVWPPPEQRVPGPPHP